MTEIELRGPSKNPDIPKIKAKNSTVAQKLCCLVFCLWQGGEGSRRSKKKKKRDGYGTRVKKNYGETRYYKRNRLPLRSAYFIYLIFSTNIFNLLFSP